MASNTFRADEPGTPRFRVKDQGLVTAVLAGDGASATADTLGRVKLGIDNAAAVQVGGKAEERQELSDKAKQEQLISKWVEENQLN